MKDARTETVTELLRKHRDLSSQLLELLAPEIMSYETIRAEHERKRLELRSLEDQKTLVRLEIEKAKEEAGRIIQKGKDEAEKLHAIAKNTIYERVTEANKLLDACKQFVADTEKKRYNKLRDEAEKMVA